MEKKVIVNADDLGINAEVNCAIFDFIKLGRVTSATILANGAEVEDAARRTQEFSNTSFGVHLNASDFFPLAPTLDLIPVLDKDGSFAGNRLREITITRQLRSALFTEWSAQIQKLMDLGVHLSHIDSHYHMHTVPGVFPVIKKLQLRFGITKVRASMNIYSRADSPRSKIFLIKKFFWNAGLRYLGTTTTTDGFTGLQVFCQSAFEKKIPFKAIELMVHPGNPLFVDETNILSSQWENSLPFPIRLINYHEL